MFCTALMFLSRLRSVDSCAPGKLKHVSKRVVKEQKQHRVACGQSLRTTHSQDFIVSPHTKHTRAGPGSDFASGILECPKKIGDLFKTLLQCVFSLYRAGGTATPRYYFGQQHHKLRDVGVERRREASPVSVFRSKLGVVCAGIFNFDPIPTKI